VLGGGAPARMSDALPPAERIATNLHPLALVASRLLSVPAI